MLAGTLPGPSPGPLTWPPSDSVAWEPRTSHIFSRLRRSRVTSGDCAAHTTQRSARAVPNPVPRRPHEPSETPRAHSGGQDQARQPRRCRAAPNLFPGSLGPGPQPMQLSERQQADGMGGWDWGGGDSRLTFPAQGPRGQCRPTYPSPPGRTAIASAPPPAAACSACRRSTWNTRGRSLPPGQQAPAWRPQPLSPSRGGRCGVQGSV